MSDAIAQAPTEDSEHSNIVNRNIPNSQPTSYPASENFGTFKQPFFSVFMKSDRGSF